MSRNTYYPGVINANHLAIQTNEGPRMIVAHNALRVTRLLALAEYYKLHTLWVAPNNALSHCDPLSFEDADQSQWNIQYSETPASPSHLPRMKSVSAWRRHEKYEPHRISIIFIEQGEWGWQEEDPLTLLLAIMALQKTAALPMVAHPGVFGRELMKWTFPRDLQIRPQVDLRLIEGARCGRDLAWKRPITELNEHYKSGAYLHAYDKNSQRLSAAEGADLGIGDPQYHGKENMKPPNLLRPGIWRISAGPKVAGRGYDPKVYPLARFSHKLPWPLSNEQEWVTTPLLKVLLEMGAQVDVFEGYEWATTRRILRKWANLIWDWRNEFSGDATPSGRIYFDSTKRIATATLGLLASEKSWEIDPMWYRPDWLSTIIELAKARILYNIYKYGSEWHIWPCMIFIDCLYYVSDSPDPDGRLLAREKELGGYKHKGCWPITEEMLTWFDSDISAGELAMRLKELGELEHV